jgi:serine phosphatase RsbU (regulator of sigma subunit)/anti-sigma regulatory factor (Ser/Thr protein kinase)
MVHVQRRSGATEVASAVAAEAFAVRPSAAALTLTLGIDAEGRIVQHDRAATDILCDGAQTLLGTDLSALIAGPGDPEATLRDLIEAIRSDRDATTVLTVRAASRPPIDAVVTVEPLRAVDPALIAQVTMRLPPPAAERFIDPGLMRHALLDGDVRRIGGALDIDQIAPALVNILVPHFCNTASLMILESVVGDSEHAHRARGGDNLVRRLAIAHDDGDPAWGATFPVGELLRYPPRTPYSECLDTGEPVSVVLTEDAAQDLARRWLRAPVAQLFAGASILMLPLHADDGLLGFFACARRLGFHRFDAYDTKLGMEFASRSALVIETARRFSRERATALTLQRSMLPTGLSHPASVQVRHRYLPGSKLVEIGGDWYESIALPGGRVALAVGDVAGHGVRAAVTMGRLRTAIKTLTMLELGASETLQRLDDLMQELGEFEPHFATCAFAIYDSVSGACEIASAGHLPPLLVRPDGESEYLDVAPAPPLGIGSSPITSRTVQIDDGSLLVMYTDGLVERRRQDIDAGLDRLRQVFAPGSSASSLDDLCRAALAGVYDNHERDDIALLVARLHRIDRDRHVAWNLAAKLTAARRARSLIRRPLRRWGLAELIPVAELAVSELVTNAVRYAQGKIGVRLVLEGRGLFCEVLDESAAMPRLRHTSADDERGRGLQVVSQIAQRWGTRRSAAGKVVWCELAVPESARPSRPAGTHARAAADQPNGAAARTTASAGRLPGVSTSASAGHSPRSDTPAAASSASPA